MSQRLLSQQSLASLQSPVESVFEEPEVVEEFQLDAIEFPDENALKEMVAQEFTAMGLTHQNEVNNIEGEEE